MELEPDAVDHCRAENSGVSKLSGVGLAAEGASDAGKGVAADDAVGIGVVEAICAATEEQIVVGGELVIESCRSEPVAVVADEVSGIEWGDDRRGAILAAVFCSHKKVR